VLTVDKGAAPGDVIARGNNISARARARGKKQDHVLIFLLDTRCSMQIMYDGKLRG